jgi:hypothetical protein
MPNKWFSHVFEICGRYRVILDRITAGWRLTPGANIIEDWARRTGNRAIIINEIDPNPQRFSRIGLKLLNNKYKIAPNC